MKIGELIKNRRKELGWSLQRLVEESGVKFDRQHLFKIEKDKSFPTVDTIDKLCAALDCELIITLKLKT